MHIVLVSSGQPSANPRLVKEAVTYSDAGHKVTVVYCPLSPWADIHDKDLFGKHPSISWVSAGFHPVHQKLLYLFARVRQKFYNVLYRAGLKNAFVAVRSMALFTQELHAKAKRLKGDLFIGHNLSALPVVVAVAEKNSAPAVFDFEDFHRGEDQEGSLHWKKTTIVEDAFTSRLHYAITASPLITETYSQLYPTVKFTTINNCFPLRFLQPEKKTGNNTELRLFWFSQFVGKKRGLETVIEGIGLTGNNKILLTLLGNCSEEVKEYFISYAKEKGLLTEQLQFLPAVAEQSISFIAATHDIGLACEVPHILNRDICLTNKIFLYLLAGNAVLFSNTKAQSLFYNSYPGIGSIYQHDDAAGLAVLLQQYVQNRDLLNRQQASALALGKELFNWEKEQQQLLQLVSAI